MTGIYPHVTREHVRYEANGGQSWMEVEETPGLTRRRRVVADPWTEERSNCFCCSCDDDNPGNDAACRNHGFAAMRPCEVHGMPGSEWDEEFGGGGMPESVQAVRRSHEQSRHDI